MKNLLIEAIGWISTVAFLVSILNPKRVRLHQLGVFTAVTTGIYAYFHGAIAIWVKWAIAFFFHAFMCWKESRNLAICPGPARIEGCARSGTLSG
jgi:hypothetical protein